MTDIVERLRGGYKFGDSDTVLEAADRIAELERELAAETNNKREFERDWLACCDKLEASQAREKVLRDALGLIADHNRAYIVSPREIADAALATPTDDTALRAALAPLQGFKDAVLDEIVICGIYSKAHEDDPRKALSDAILWNTQVALDPNVSEEMRAALKAERERVAKHFEPRSYLGSGHQLAVEIRALGD